MNQVDNFKSLGLISFMILSFGLSFIVIKWPAGVDHTFSQHIAKRKVSIIFYIVLFLIVLIPLLLFFIKWFGPTFKFGLFFYVFALLAIATQFLCTLVPETSGWREKSHRLLAFLSAAAIMPITLLIALNNQVNVMPRIVATTSLLIMIYFVIIMAKYNARHPKALIIQAIYFALFFITILSATYISY